MSTKMLICLSLVGVCCGCDVRKSEKAWLQWRLNSMKSELEASRKDMEMLLEVGNMMDSIDRNRYDVLVDWREQRTPFNKYKYRLRAINNYVVETEMKIAYLEEQVSRVKSTNSDAVRIVAQLQDRIRRRNLELRNLKEQLSRNMYENQELFHRASQQHAEFDNHEKRLQEKEEELEVLHMKIAAAQEAYLMAQAESCYREAQALEELANRTHFANGKKREALEQGLALYRRSLMLGMEEARTKVLELEETLN